MTKTLGWVGALVGGYLGWWLGARVSMFTAFIASIVGTACGLYFGRRIGATYLE